MKCDKHDKLCEWQEVGRGVKVLRCPDCHRVIQQAKVDSDRSPQVRWGKNFHRDIRCD